MAEGHAFSCPKCGGTDHLVIQAMTSVLLLQDNQGEFETVGMDASHEWHDDSPMLCKDCGYSGTVMNFDKEGREE